MLDQIRTSLCLYGKALAGRAKHAKAQALLKFVIDKFKPTGEKLSEVYHLKAELGLRGASVRNKAQLTAAKDDAETAFKSCVGHMKIVRSLTLIDCLKELKDYEEAKKVLAELNTSSPFKARLIQQHLSLRLRSKNLLETDFTDGEKKELQEMISQCDTIADQASPKDSIFRLEQIHRSFMNQVSVGLLVDAAAANATISSITSLIGKFHGDPVFRSNQLFYDASLLTINLNTRKSDGVE